MARTNIGNSRFAGKGREKLRQGLDLLREMWSQTDLNPDRDPNQRGDHNQNNNTGQGEEAKLKGSEGVVPTDPGGDVVNDLPRRKHSCCRYRDKPNNVHHL